MVRRRSVGAGTMGHMRYRRAVEKPRLLAEGCERVGDWPPEDEPFLVSMYAFGDVLEGADPLEEVQVVGVIRIWSQDGPDTDTLDALAERRFSDLRRLTPSPVDERLQVRDELDAALRHLRQVHDSYWDYEWRRDHRGGGRYPEHELRDAVYGYLNLLDAAKSAYRDGAPSNPSSGA
jgi:hypothetical protein